MVHETLSLDPGQQQALAHGLSQEHAELLEQTVHWVQAHYLPAVVGGGQPLWAHCVATSETLAMLQTDAPTRIAALLLALPAHEGAGIDPVAKQFGAQVSQLVQGTRALLRLGEVTREAGTGAAAQAATQKENLRRMLLAMAADLRIVLIRLASRLQTLRWHAKTKTPCDIVFAQETLDLYAPLANRLGIWQIKWELEDLAFRFKSPDDYREIARQIEQKRAEREDFITRTVQTLEQLLAEAGIAADISGRPKHIYSIWNKMQRKEVDFNRLYDLRALRVIVADERTCYNVLGIVHAHWSPIGEEFDDYISRPKPNGYRSLHTVVADEQGYPFEVQIRTLAMHDFAEHGMAAHWRYKESGGSDAQSGGQDRQLAWMRELLAWQSQAGDQVQQSDVSPVKATSDRIYVLSPQARVIELPRGSTAVDFAYHLHTDLGHRCRGARVNGHMVPLQTPLETGQTVEIITTKAGGPSRDWLNPQLGYLASARARAKVRAWFNAIELQQRITQGHALVEKELGRLGKTAVNQEQLAQQLGFAHADDLYVAVAKEDFSLRHLDAAFQPQAPQAEPSAQSMVNPMRAPETHSGSGVLVQGVGSLLTQLARCCRPAPPDAIAGFVTRGRGVSIHRADCPSYLQLGRRDPERVIEVAWGDTHEAVYPVDLSVRAQDRAGLLRDLSEVFARLRLNVIGVNTQSKSSLAHMVFTVEVGGADVIKRALVALSEVKGVMSAERR